MTPFPSGRIVCEVQEKGVVPSLGQVRPKYEVAAVDSIHDSTRTPYRVGMVDCE